MKTRNRKQTFTRDDTQREYLESILQDHPVLYFKFISINKVYVSVGQLFLEKELDIL